MQFPRLDWNLGRGPVVGRVAGLSGELLACAHGPARARTPGAWLDRHQDLQADGEGFASAAQVAAV